MHSGQCKPLINITIVKFIGSSLNKLNINQPKNAFANSVQQTINKANEIGYPVLIRPSYVLGGRAMQIAYDSDNLKIFSKERS